MRWAFVLISSAVGAEREVLKALRGIPEVKEIHMVYGAYDVITRVEAETIQQIKDVFLKIRRLDGVRSELTTMCVEATDGGYGPGGEGGP